MQHLHTHSDGQHLCLLSDAELALLRHAAARDAWRPDFLRSLYALPADEASANAVARAVERYPELFQMAPDRYMTIEEWAAAVRAGWWRVPGVGPARAQKLAQALGNGDGVAHRAAH